MDPAIIALEKRIALLEHICLPQSQNDEQQSLVKNLTHIEGQVNEILEQEPLFKHIYSLVSRAKLWSELGLLGHSEITQNIPKDAPPLDVRVALVSSKIQTIRTFADQLHDFSDPKVIPDPADSAKLADLEPLVQQLEGQLHNVLSQHEELAVRTAQLQRFWMQNILQPDNAVWSQADQLARDAELQRRRQLHDKVDQEEY